MANNTPIPPHTRPAWTLAGAMLMTGVLGSVHSFSVLVAPLQALLSVSRAQVSLLYSFALVFLTVAVLLGHRVFPLASPPRIAAAVCITAAAGLFVSASADTFSVAWLGYSLLFGAANGIGYGFSLQIAAQAMPARKGFAMGAVTAVYAVGATLFAKLFAMVVAAFSVDAALALMGAVLLVVGAFAVALLRASGAVYASSAAVPAQFAASSRTGLLILLGAGYGFGAAAGLMAIAHAAGIVAAAGGDAAQWVLGAMLIGIGNVVGGFSAGWVADRWPLRWLLSGLPLLSALALLLLAQNNDATVAIVALAVVGFAYGAIIAVYPAAVSEYFGAHAAARMYGRVFIAWGVAGLAAPWLAGAVFDWSGGYLYALLIAAGAGLLSTAAAWFLPARRTDQQLRECA